MTIQVTQITGDVVELAFPPREEDLRVGDVLSVVDRRSRRGLIVQILEIRTAPGAFKPQQTFRPPRHHTAVPATTTRRSPKVAAPPSSAYPSKHLAIAKIRKLTTPDWQAWDGWIPTHDAVVARMPDQELVDRCLLPTEQPLLLGRTLAAERLAIDTRALVGLNLVSGTDEGEIALLTSVILRALAAHGLPCIVFDLCGTACILSEPRGSASTSQAQPSHVVRLRVGDEVKLDVRQCSPAALLDLLTRFGLPNLPALYVVSQVAPRPVCTTSSGEAVQPSPFLGIEELIQLIDGRVASSDQVQLGAILGCLRMIKQEGVLASTPADTVSFPEHYETIRQGGRMIVDLSTVANAARGGVVRAIFDNLVRLHTQQNAGGSPRWPCLILEEPQLYFNQRDLHEILMRASSLGMTSFILTTCPSSLELGLLRRIDNLFLLSHRSGHELQSLANSGLLDHETASSLACRLGSRQGLLVGKATRRFPVIFAFEAVDEASATLPDHVVRRARSELASSGAATPRRSSSPPAPDRAYGEPTLPLFPEEAPAQASPLPPAQAPPREPAASESSREVSLALIIARWDRVLKRVGRRRRILETILSTARPVHLEGHTLLLGFPPQSRFQQELMASPEYRGLLEEELTNLFGVALEVTATLHPLSDTPQR